MAAPFEPRSLESPSRLARWLHLPVKRNALNVIETALAAAERVRDVDPVATRRDAETHGVDLGRAFLPERVALYERFLRQAYDDESLSDDEVADLKHLKKVLCLVERDVRAVHESLYEQALEGALADRSVSEREAALLEALRSELQLPKRIADRIYASGAKESLEAELRHALSDQRLSPAEEAELARLGEHLGVRGDWVPGARQTLDRYREWWLIENGALPAIEVPVRLQRGERCYASAEVRWHELRKVPKGYRYGGLAGRMKLLPGLYWRWGDVDVAQKSSEVMKERDAGTVYLTDRRLLFDGVRSNKVIRLDRILHFTAFRNGIEIERDRGKSPFLEFETPPERFGMLFSRALDDAHRGGVI